MNGFPDLTTSLEQANAEKSGERPKRERPIMDTPEQGREFTDRVLRGDELPPEFLDEVPPECTDEALALRFSEDHAHELRHVAAWGKWLEWSGTCWKPDATLATFNRARIICRRASSGCDNIKVAAKVASASTVAAVERLAKADRRHAATIEQWDSDPWLLNTPGGTVDLRTGKMRRHSPTDHLTKITAVAPGGECPLWHQFLAKVTNNDTELQGYLKRMAGYALTGSIREHALFFAYGTGANGKGVSINTLTGIMGDYACVASIETFTASTSDRHPTDLAMLRGARLVTAQETEEGRRWAESRIKAMTGGDPITARFMRQDFFTFEPTFKLLIAGNHRPGLRNVDEAIRRRFNLLPFAVKIPPAERDLDLPEKLKAEWPGILKWAIEGCLEWQKIGLAAPAAVIDATAEYLAAEDAMASWLAECCSNSGHTSAAVLFASWKSWAEAAGEMPGSQKRFSQALIQRGYDTQRLTDGRAGFLSISFKPAAQPDESADGSF
jgi:putative DNA primase/helicase